MIRVRAAIKLRDAIAPPLQTDLSSNRLAHGFGRFGHLIIEGVKRDEMPPQRLRHENGREIAVVIRFPHDLFRGGGKTIGHGSIKRAARNPDGPRRSASKFHARCGPAAMQNSMGIESIVLMRENMPAVRAA